LPFVNSVKKHAFFWYKVNEPHSQRSNPHASRSNGLPNRTATRCSTEDLYPRQFWPSAFPKILCFCRCCNLTGTRKTRNPLPPKPRLITWVSSFKEPSMTIIPISQLDRSLSHSEECGSVESGFFEHRRHQLPKDWKNPIARFLHDGSPIRRIPSASRPFQRSIA
jgi:hypothetical protein